MVESYCVKCKKKTNQINSLIHDSGRGIFSIGNCESCGQKTSIIVPKSFLTIPIPIESEVKPADNLNLTPKEYEARKNQLATEEQAKPLSKEEKVKLWNENYGKDDFEVIDKKARNNSKIAWFIAIIFLIGTLGFLYFSNQEAYKTVISFNPNITAVCEETICNSNCPACPNVTMICGDCNVPDELKVEIINST